MSPVDTDAREHLLFTGGLDKIDQQLDPQARTKLSTSLEGEDDPVEAKAGALNLWWVAKQLKQDPGDLAPQWHLARDNVASQLTKQPQKNVSETQLYGMIGAHLQKNKDERVMTGAMSEHMQSAAIEGETNWLNAYQDFVPKMVKDPGYRPESADDYRHGAQAYFKSFQDAHPSVAPMAREVADYYNLEQKKIDPDQYEAQRGELIGKLAVLSPMERQAVLTHAGAMSAKMNPPGEAGAQQPGTGMLHNVGVAFDRGLSGLVDSSVRAGKGAFNQFTNAIRMGDMMKPVDYSADRNREDIGAQLDSTFQEVAAKLPMDHWYEKMAYGGAQMIPQVAPALINPVAGTALLAASMSDQAAQSYIQKGIDPEKAHSLGIVTGGVQAGLMVLSGRLVTGATPLISNAVSKMVQGESRSLLQAGGQALVFGGATTALINTGQAGIDLTPEVMQGLASKIDKAVPGVTWFDQKDALGNVTEKGILTPFLKGRVDTALTLLPLSLVGTGHFMLQEGARTRALLAHPDVGPALGIPAEKMALVANAPTAEVATQRLQQYTKESYEALLAGAGGHEAGAVLVPVGERESNHREVANALQETALARLDAEHAASEPKPTGVKATQQPGGGFLVTDEGGKVIDRSSDPQEAAGLVHDVVQQRETSLKNATGDTERESYGLEEATPTEKRVMSESWARSGQALTADPTAGATLAKEVIENPNRGMSDDESALLLRHKMGIENALNQAHDDYVKAQTPEEKADAQKRAVSLSEDLHTLLDAIKARGASWGREGRWRQALAREDFSFASQEGLLRAAKKGAALTDAERAQLTQQIDTLREKSDELALHLKSLQEVRSPEHAVSAALDDIVQNPEKGRRIDPYIQGIAERIGNKLTKQANKSKKYLAGKLFTISPDVLYHLSVIGADHIYRTGLNFAKWSASIIGDIGEKVRPHLKEVYEASQHLLDTQAEALAGAGKAPAVKGIITKTALPQEKADLLGKIEARLGSDNPNITPLVHRLARNLVESGVTDRDQLITEVHNALKEINPDITRRQAMDAISGYGQFQPLTQGEIETKLRDLKGQMQQLAKLDDIAQGRSPEKTGVERRVASPEESKLIDEVNAAKEKAGLGPTEADRAKTAAKAVDKLIAQMEAELGGEKEKEGKPTPDSPELKAKREYLDALRQFKEAMKTVENPDAKALRLHGERVIAASKVLEKSIAQVEAELSGAEKKAGKTPLDTPELQAMREQLAGLRTFRDEMKTVENPQAKALREIKAGLAKRIAELEKQIATRERSKPVVEGTPVTDSETEAMKARRDELQKQADTIFKTQGLTPEQRLNIYRNHATARIMDLQDRLAKGDFAPEPKRAPLAGPEADRLRSEVERAKQAFAVARERAKENAQGPAQKALRLTADLARASAISGYHTLAKLASFTVQRMAEIPLVEAAGALISKIPGVSSIAARANMEAGSLGIGRLYAAFATKGMQEAYQTITTGKGNLKAELGEAKHNAQPFHWYDLFGISHMAEKAPLLTANFEMYLARATEHADAHGVDVTDPMVQAGLRKDAYAYAQRAILQENNMVADWINGLTAKMEKDNPKLGRPDINKLVGAAFIKAFLTKGIVRVPSNYVSQVMERTPFGLAAGATRLIAAHIHGVESLSPQEANAILRLLKVGAVGSAMFIWGAVDATRDEKDRVFGGYYQPGKKRGATDVEVAKFRINGVQFPHLLSHNPMIEVAQMGSTMMRVASSKLSKKDKEDEGLLAGSIAAVFSMASNAPIVNPITQMAERQMYGHQEKYLWDSVGGLIPQLVQNVAVDTDSATAKRDPKTITQSLEMRVPGLREQVPFKHK